MRFDRLGVWVLAGHTWLATKFPEAAQTEVFSDPNVLIASLIRLGCAAPERATGGFVWRGGRGKFCSGIDHAHWVLAGGVVTEADGTNVQRYFLIPRSDIKIEDDWYTAGLRGTGSKSIVVNDAFIPEHRSVTFASMLDGTAPGGAISAPYYRLPFQLVWPMSLPGTALGTARAALTAYTEMVRGNSARFRMRASRSNRRASCGSQKRARGSIRPSCCCSRTLAA